jgi:hypothetical protein
MGTWEKYLVDIKPHYWFKCESVAYNTEQGWAKWGSRGI